MAKTCATNSPKTNKKTFETHERYKPDAIGEQLEEFESNDEDWRDEAFSDLEDYQTFWGGDFSEVGGWVYKKEIDGTREELESEMERFETLSEQVQEMELGTQLRFQ